MMTCDFKSRWQLDRKCELIFVNMAAQLPRPLAHKASKPPSSAVSERLLLVCLFFLFFQSIKTRFRQELDLNPRADPDGLHGHQGPGSGYWLPVCCAGCEFPRPQPPKPAQWHRPDLPWVPWPFQRADVAAGLGLCREDPLDRGFLVPAGLPGVGLSFAFPAGLFPALWKLETFSGDTGYSYVQEVSREFISAPSLGNVKSVFFHARRTDHVPRWCAASPPPSVCLSKKWVHLRITELEIMLSGSSGLVFTCKSRMLSWMKSVPLNDGHGESRKSLACWHVPGMLMA